MNLLINSADQSSDRTRNSGFYHRPHTCQKILDASSAPIPQKQNRDSTVTLTVSSGIRVNRSAVRHPPVDRGVNTCWFRSVRRYEMFPTAHFIVALLPAVGFVLLRDRRLPSLRFVAVVFLGSQFPDLIDKPLAHQFGVLPSGRVFMHSLPTALPVLFLVGLYGWQTNRIRLSGAFIFAHLSHLLADNYSALLGPDPWIPSDLLWPLGPPITRSNVLWWAGPGSIIVQLWTLFSIVVLSLVGYALIVDIREQFTPYQGG